MPIYMDFHHFPNGITVEQVKEAHMADLATQDEFGIRYLQFWVNPEQGFVFCLVEGPNPESCEKAHQSAHGNIPCNLQEVEQGMFNIFMGKNIPHINHLALTKNGAVDVANRVILLVDILGLISQKLGDFKPQDLKVPYQPKKACLKLIQKHHGRLYEHDEVDSLIAVFNSSHDAVSCALNIQQEFIAKINSPADNAEWNIEFRISVNHDQPLKHEGGFFESSLKNSKRYAMMAKPNSIVFSSDLKRQVQELQSMFSINKQRILAPREEIFIQKMFEALHTNLSSETFDVEELVKLMNSSRSNLYRKTKTVFGLSPNQFIKSYRLYIAKDMLEKKAMKINEVAFKVGYSNPSYFSKLFKEEYGVLPSKVSVAI